MKKILHGKHEISKSKRGRIDAFKDEVQALLDIAEKTKNTVEGKVAYAVSKKEGYEEIAEFWTKTKRRVSGVLAMLEEKMKRIEDLPMKAQERFGASAAMSQKTRGKAKLERRAVKRLNKTSTKTSMSAMMPSFFVTKSKPKRYDMIPYACSRYKLM